MITAIVQIQMPEPATLDQVTEVFQGTAPRYRGVPGLVRKYYLFDAESQTSGGCYLFEDRAAAEAAFDADWRALIKDKYGAEPNVAYFETPVVVDNASGEISGVAAE